MPLELTVLGLPDFEESLRFLQPKQNFLNHLVTRTVIDYAFTFYTKNVFGCLHGIITLFKLV